MMLRVPWTWTSAAPYADLSADQPGPGEISGAADTVGQRALDQGSAECREGKACMRGCLGNQARVGHAGHGVDLEHPRTTVVDHEVHARDVTAAQGPADLDRCGLRTLGHPGGNSGSST